MSTTDATNADEVGAITDVLHRYAFAIDDQRWDELRTIFTSECRADYGQFGTFDSSDAVADWMGDAHVGLISHHAISNIAVEVDGDRATARSYVTVSIVHAATDRLMRTGGEYRDVMVRIDGHWQICERRYRTIWQDGTLSSS